MKKKEIMQQMLQDVIDQFVVNPESRATKDGKCTYIRPLEKENISPGCAIGMYLSDEIASELEGIGSISIILNSTIRDLLPEWMRTLPKQFLKDIQNFHDFDDNFTKIGLSNRGLNSIKAIVREHSLKLPKIKSKNLP